MLFYIEGIVPSLVADPRISMVSTSADNFQQALDIFADANDFEPLKITDKEGNSRRVAAYCLGCHQLFKDCSCQVFTGVKYVALEP